jgi:hypothetical protein
MRPKTKVDASRITLTLSGPARAWLMEQAQGKSTSQTQIVEELIELAKGSSAARLQESPSSTIPFPSSDTSRKPPMPYRRASKKKSSG